MARNKRRIAPMAKFNPEGKGYDVRGARRVKMKGDASGHKGSVGAGGIILKGRKHATFKKAVEAERKRGAKVIKKGTRYYTTKP